MKRMSAKRRRLMASLSQQRADYLAEFPRCVLGCGNAATCVHEIARGAYRQKAVSEPCTWLAVCQFCNAGPLTNVGEWPISRQLALKHQVDVARFNMRRFNSLRAGAGRKIDVLEVLDWIDDETGELKRIVLQ